MKKFSFQLERVLRYHQQRLKQADLRVAQAAREREASQTVVQQFLQQIDRDLHSNESVGSFINPAIRTNLTAHITHLEQSLHKARERLKVAEQRFRETVEIRAEISKSVEGLSQLRDVKRQEHTAEVNRQLQIEVDEVVMRKWSAREPGDTPERTKAPL